VEDILFTIVNAGGGAFSYGVVFFVLLACGLGIPLPEDVALILGGFLVYEEKAQLVPMMVTGYLGIIIGDSMIFYFGRRLGTKVGAEGKGGFFAN
jgi:membrane protein DedA with SNARE-associated domain